MENYKYMVWVSCLTYNHASYIEDAMNGFCMQETSFPFVCGIMEDFSTDGEQEVIRKYLHDHFDLTDNNVVRNEETDDYVLTFAQHKTNKNCFFAVLFMKYNHYQLKKSRAPYVQEWVDNAKYIAMCEGDDYWTDSLKLQKQVDFMESHPENSLCFCNNIKLYPDGRKEMIPRYPSDMNSCPMADLIKGGGGAMSTHTMLYRKALFVPASTWVKDCPVGDLPLMLTLAAKGSVGFLSDVVGVHRFEAKGSWTSRMATDRKKNKNVSRAIVKMYKQFDEWTDYKYHTAIRKKIRDIKTSILKGDIVFYVRKLLRK